MNKHIISEAEAGVRVLRFLERRLGLPRPLLYRWLRSGQVRVNKGRIKADYLLCTGDELRLPPQAALVSSAPVAMVSQSSAVEPAASSALFALSVQEAPDNLGPGLRVIYSNKHVLLLNKASGLPVQPGSGHSDSVSQRLKDLTAAAGDGTFVPAPAHRLDKQSSGLIVAGRTHIALRRLHELFSQQTESIQRRYLVWVAGNWQLPPQSLLEDPLAVESGTDGRERMAVVQAVAESPAAEVKSAQGIYSALRFLEASPCGPATLLEVCLISGRKHQIRVQCASRGHPVLGDRRYNGPLFSAMLLHAYKLTLPGGEFMGENFAAVEGQALPDWPEPFAVSNITF